MSEQTPEAAPATETTETTASTTETTPAESTPAQPKPTETVDFWKQKAREQESRAKSNAEAAKRLLEIEDAQKTEAQRISERQAAIERERDEARADGLRYKAAAKHGISEDYFDLLGAGDEETITARAERVGGLLKLQSENEQLKAELEALKEGKSAPQNQRPAPALKPGATAEQITPAEDDSYPSHWFKNRVGDSQEAGA